MLMSGMKYLKKAVTMKTVKFMFSKYLNSFQYIGIFFLIGTPWFNHAHAEEPQDSVLRVMTYNACRGSTAQSQSLSQTARMTELAKADTVVFPYPKDYRAVAATFTVVK